MTAPNIFLGIVLFLAPIAVAVLWIRLERMKEEAAKWHRNYLASVAAHAETRRGWEKDSQCWGERLTVARARLAEIVDLISRRPPRRRWLAMTRTIAKIAANGV